jgi:endonuclease/exonuclease/phosphatase family metal-dependent hydrolase
MLRARVVWGVVLLGVACRGAAEPDDAGGDVATSTTADTLDSSGDEATEPLAPPGEITVLTYNVAGLPQGISSSDPERNIPQISPLLNGFDLVLVQEDFWYHAELVAEVMHPYRSEPYTDDPMNDGVGDGLNLFTRFGFGELERVPWYACHGQLDCSSDCLAKKGWSFARHTLDEGVEVDIYNLHMEAGSCPEDLEIRSNSADHLVEAIEARSEGRAVIVAGDFNLKATRPDDVESLRRIIEGAGLTNACEAVDCGDQRIDMIMVRSAADLDIEVLSWWLPEEFVDAETGEPLSDHLPVAATLRYTPS